MATSASPEVPPRVRQLATELAKYCSLNNPDPLGYVEAARALTLARPEIVGAHFPFYAARIDPIPTRNHAFLKNLIENRFM